MSDSPFEGFGIPIPIPPEISDMLRKRHDRNHMAAEAMAAQVETFLSGLDVDGLMALRTILNTGELSGNVTANFFDGQLVAILRYVHHVDPETGRNPLAAPEGLDPRGDL